jgi:hypothetical protein
MYEHGTLKLVKVILRMERGKRDNNLGDKPNQGTLCAYMEMSPQKPLSNYCKLIKTFLKVVC